MRSGWGQELARRLEFARFAIPEYSIVMLKSQDLLVILKLAEESEQRPTFPYLANSLGISASEAHAAVKRAARSGLVDEATRTVKKAALLEFIEHAVKYMFPPDWEGVTPGVATSYAAAPLNSHFRVEDLPPVWPHPLGTVRGEGLAPLYRSAPDAAMRDPQLYQWLALVDAIRAGRARERQLAIAEVSRRLAP